MDKVDSLEQMIYNLNAKTKDQYKLVNDRITEAFDIINNLIQYEQNSNNVVALASSYYILGDIYKHQDKYELAINFHYPLF